MTTSNAEGFILLLFGGQEGATRSRAAGKGLSKLSPLFNVSESILDRQRKGGKKETKFDCRK